jgi:hypothetical protein
MAVALTNTLMQSCLTTQAYALAYFLPRYEI